MLLLIKRLQKEISLCLSSFARFSQEELCITNVIGQEMSVSVCEKALGKWLLVIVCVAERPDSDVERDEIGQDEHGEEDERRRHCMFSLPPPFAADRFQ